jgi:hypothetical protein
VLFAQLYILDFGTPRIQGQIESLCTEGALVKARPLAQHLQPLGK